jgi:superfamily I DNA/RNA helicase
MGCWPPKTLPVIAEWTAAPVGLALWAQLVRKNGVARRRVARWGTAFQDARPFRDARRPLSVGFQRDEGRIVYADAGSRCGAVRWY